MPFNVIHCCHFVMPLWGTEIFIGSMGMNDNQMEKIFQSTNSVVLFWHCVYYASCCNVLMTNKMHSSYNQFLFHSFLFAVHVSNKSSRSSSAAWHNILYYTVWYNHAGLHDCTKLCNILYYAVLLMMND